MMKPGIYVIQEKGSNHRELARIHESYGKSRSASVTMINDVDASWYLWELLDTYDIICLLDLSNFAIDSTIEIPKVEE